MIEIPMDSGFDKTRRNLLIATTATAIYHFIGLQPSNSSYGMFSFIIEQPSNVIWVLYLATLYFYYRYITYYKSTGGRKLELKDKNERIKILSKNMEARFCEKIYGHDHVNKFQYFAITSISDNAIEFQYTINTQSKKASLISKEHTLYKDIQREAAWWRYFLLRPHFFEREMPLIFPALILIILFGYELTRLSSTHIYNNLYKRESIQVIDGDSFKMHGDEYRLWGIDALEYKQTCRSPAKKTLKCGISAKKALENIVENSKDISCETIKRDQYERMVVRCDAEGKDIGALMVQSGYAFDYDRYSKGFYAEDERYAREELKGVWFAEFDKPWIYRKRK